MVQEESYTYGFFSVANISRTAVDIGQVDALYECCNAFYEKQGETASTVSCPKYSLLRFVKSVLVTPTYLTNRRLKMEQRAKAISSSSD